MPQNTNKWMGCESYPDPKTKKSPKSFYGRTSETYDLVELIDNNIFVTLYGKSGCGKTSLLNAGAFPILRDKSYLPVYIRLWVDAFLKLDKHHKPQRISFQKCILEKLSQAFEESHITVKTFDVVPESGSEEDANFLWTYFARNRFVNEEGNQVFPVIVLDQFEEVLRSDRRLEAEKLLRQIYYLMDESHELESSTLPSGETYVYDSNFRFVLSIREDDLFMLEDSIDNNYLSDMKRCRYRLRNLSRDGAREVIILPGKELYDNKDESAILDIIMNEAVDAEDSSEITTIKLSLICSQLWDEFHSEPKDSVTADAISKFLASNPVDGYYKIATASLKRRERSYIVKHFVDSAGRRETVSESQLKAHVKNWSALLDKPQHPLFHRTPTNSGDYIVELIHDTFCAPMVEEREQILARERNSKRVLYITAFLAVVIFGIFFILKDRDRRNLRDKMITHYIVPDLTGDNAKGDINRAVRTLLYRFNGDVDSVRINLLRNMSYNYIVGRHAKRINSISGNSGYLVTTSNDSTVRVWEKATFSCVREFRCSEIPNYAVFIGADTIKINNSTNVSIRQDNKTDETVIISAWDPIVKTDSTSSFRKSFPLSVSGENMIAARFQSISKTYGDDIKLSNIEDNVIVNEILDKAECNDIYSFVVRERKNGRPVDYSILTGNREALYKISYKGEGSTDFKKKLTDNNLYDYYTIEKYRIPFFGYNRYKSCYEDPDYFYLAYDNVIRAVSKVRVVNKESDNNNYTIENFYLTPDGNGIIIAEWDKPHDNASTKKQYKNRIRKISISSGKQIQSVYKTKTTKTNEYDSFRAIAAYEKLDENHEYLGTLRIFNDRASWIGKDRNWASRNNNVLDKVRYSDVSMDYDLNYLVYIDPKGKSLWSYDLKTNEKCLLYPPTGTSTDSLIVATISQVSSNSDGISYYRVFTMGEKGSLSMIELDNSGSFTVKDTIQTIKDGVTKATYAHRLTSDASSFIVCKKNESEGVRLYNIYKMFEPSTPSSSTTWEPIATDVALGNISGIIPVTNTIPDPDAPEGRGTVAVIEINSGLSFYPNYTAKPYEPVFRIIGDFTQMRIPDERTNGVSKGKAYISTPKEILEFDMRTLLPKDYIRSLVENIKDKCAGKYLTEEEEDDILKK